MLDAIRGLLPRRWRAGRPDADRHRQTQRRRRIYAPAM